MANRIVFLAVAMLVLLIGSALIASTDAITLRRRKSPKYRSIPKKQPPADSLKLKFVHTIFRHGDRTPLTILPGDTLTDWYCDLDVLQALGQPLNDANDNNVLPQRIFQKTYLMDQQTFKGNCSMGQLTSIGAQQHYQLGKQFAQTYIHDLKFLSPVFNATEIYIRSTDIPRTQQSVQAQLLGMFPPQQGESVPQPTITIHTVESPVEYLVPNTALCPYLNTLINDLYATPQWVSYTKSVTPFLQQLASILKEDVKQLPPVSGIFDALFCRQSHNLPYPPGITQQMADQVAEIALYQLVNTYQNSTIAKYAMGLVVRDVLEYMQDSINNASPLKWVSYSAHDSTVGPFLAAFKIPQATWPPYAAHVVMELYESMTQPGTHFVRMLYNDEEIVVPGCSGVMCPFEQFEQIASALIPKDFAAECAQQQKNQN